MGRLACSIAIILAACGGGNTMTDGGGTPADGGGAGTDGGGPGTDGGGTPADGGVACANGTATLSDDCPFTACGGALDGTYCYTNVCLTRADLIPMATIGLCTTDNITLRDFSGTTRGSLVFAGGSVTRSVDLDAAVTLDVPQSCSFGMCGTFATALEAALAQTPLDATATCEVTAGGGCSCALTLAFQSTTADSFTAAGSTITLGTGRTYDYCTAAGTLTYRETTTGRMDTEPGVASLASP